MDFNAIATNFGQNPGADVWSQGDVNYDGAVSTADFTTFVANFGAVLAAPLPAPVEAGNALVPEPISVWMIIASLLPLQRRRHKCCERV
jgi:hypothetical protein